MEPERPDPPPVEPGAAGPSPAQPPVTFGEVLQAATPVVWVTPAIIGVNVALFVLMVLKGVPPMGPTAEDLLNWGANFGPAIVVDRQWWRLVTCAFVHVGLIHLALNMYVLWRAGPLTERLYGNAAFLVLYVLAALGGSLVSVLWSPLTVSAGASGAIFGVYGALLAFTRTANRSLPPQVVDSLRRGVVAFIFYNVIFGLTVPNISNSAHLGGLATGFAAGWLLARDLWATQDQQAERYSRSAALLLVLVALAWFAHHRISEMPALGAGRLDEEATAAIGKKDWSTALHRLDEAIAIDPANGSRFLTRGMVRENADDSAGAISDYGEALRRDPKSVTALALRCLAYSRTSDYERATSDCDDALALDGADTNAWHGRAEISRSKGLDEEALSAARLFVQGAPKEAHAHLLLAWALINTGELEAAEHEIQVATGIAPEDAEIGHVRSHLLLRRGEFAAALREAERTVSLDPKEPWGYALRASVRRALRDFEHALVDQRRAIELEPNEGSFHNSCAWTLLELGRYPEAMAEVERALELQPQSPHALSTRCWIRVSAGDRTGGRSDCERAVKALPGSLADVGMLDFLGERYEKAAAAWRRESTKYPAEAAILQVWIARAASATPAASGR